jgi:hypothetical protein
MPDLNLNPHLTGDMLWLCDACSQLITLRVELPTNLQRPRFCPWCGAEKLRSVKSTVAEQLKGACFSSFDPQLVGLLYSVWRQDPAGFLSFLDYVNDQVANVE